MAPFPELQYDYWDTMDRGSHKVVTVSVIMPNGILITLQENFNVTLAEIKEELWEEATTQPLYGKLHDMSVYSFVFINSMAEHVKIADETRTLYSIRPVGCCLIIKETAKNQADEESNSQVGHLIGKRLQEFDMINNAEINNFRFKMRKLGDEFVKSRKKMTWQQKIQYQFPPKLSKLFKEDILSQNIKIASKWQNSEGITYSSTFDIPAKIKPQKLIEMILQKRANILNSRNERPSDYVLKVCGKDEFLIGDHPIIQYEYVEDALSKDLIPTFITINVDHVPIANEQYYECLSNFHDKTPKPSYSTLTLKRKGKYKSSWDVSDNFKITLSTLGKINCDTKRTSDMYIGVQVGLFHGGKPLCESKSTDETKVVFRGDEFQCEFNSLLEFDIQVCNIPRNVKLCFVVYEVTKATRGVKFKKSKDYNKDSVYNPIGWANTTIFDFKSQLKTDAMTLYLWTYAEDNISDDFLNPLGTVVSNPDVKNATSLTLVFESYRTKDRDQTILYPPPESMVEYSSKNSKQPEDMASVFNEKHDVLKVISEIDNSTEIHDQDRKKAWTLRHYWKTTFPELLPKLLYYCIDWDSKDVISDVVAILREWPLLSCEKSLELLDYAYAEPEVRSYAVKCLHHIGDEDLLLYLLQLVQALKHELFLECDLVNFLLTRALSNQKIGHYLFWHLRSEMSVPSVSVRFGLILEAYCRGTQEHIPILQKQIDILDKLKKCNEAIRTKKDKEKAKATLKEFVEQKITVDALNSIRNPLDPSFRCRTIRTEKCRVMDSKMKPLWIVFENYDSLGEDIYIIFKNGDDLRQDMLTLQMLKIMDKLWKQEGLDLRMNPYNCISTENKVGLIEIVLNAETIANIQKEKGMFSATSAFRKGSILAWLKDYNTTETALNKAVQEFTLSCAGYCVATYVLGIGDRHSDNIMIKKSGQLFHIDFGHILGHFKEKFGIKRERVPFVLTHDFVYVINKGQKTSIEFKIFQEYCEKAFLTLRKHGNLILSLCAMMISTGLPELTSENDLNYIKETLVLLKTEDDALQHFRSKFNEALSNSWKTSLNWASHNLAKNNKA